MKVFNKEVNLEAVAAIIPLLFTFLTVFHTRESVKVFYALALNLVILEFFLIRKIAGKNFKKAYPYILIVCGSIGLAAAGILTIEKIALLKDPARITSCSLSPIVACSPVINSPEASIFTIPNPAFGILGFGLVIAAGMALLAGANSLKKWWWQTFLSGTLVGTIFCGWLIYETLYEIGSICLYCSGAWVVTIASFVTTLKYASKENAIKLPTKLRNMVEKYTLEIMVSIYALILILILQRFWSYWVSLI
ncbi:MAG: vitamin K epoxide reductase family protein [Candidatus Nomurabacteria bacterium]|nr:MAG: vitamin K epoxide reductase family protein [Candidatus Nomurabacteria bacterium]HRV76376.1 vitamin K epoxide reductase family protein [Candidatus Saccharimonadales bacterium]